MKITVSGARAHHFKHEWEEFLDEERLQPAIYDLLDGQPNYLVVVGIVLAHPENGEAAFIGADEFEETGITAADIYLDAIGDLDRLRQQALGPRDA
jgi:hypothetical protein